jgi:hypothetical protein
MHEHNNVTVVHDVVLALLSILSGFFDFRHTGLSLAQGFKVFKGTHFRFDETTLKIRVNHSSRLWGSRANLDGPCPNLLRSSGVKGLETQGLSSTSDNARNHGSAHKLRSLKTQISRLLGALIEKGCTVNPGKRSGICVRRHVKVWSEHVHLITGYHSKEYAYLSGNQNLLLNRKHFARILLTWE